VKFKAYKEVKTTTFHPNGFYICGGLADGSLKMWDL